MYPCFQIAVSYKKEALIAYVCTEKKKDKLQMKEATSYSPVGTRLPLKKSSLG